MIVGIAHINLTVPPGTLHLAEAFYGSTLGLHSVPVPERQKDSLRWSLPPCPALLLHVTVHILIIRCRFDITPKGQQVHISHGPAEAESSRHPCFRLESKEALLTLQQRIWEHHVKSDEAAPRNADKPGEKNSGMFGIGWWRGV